MFTINVQIAELTFCRSPKSAHVIAHCLWPVQKGVMLTFYPLKYLIFILGVALI